jgi:hypothetical protein
MTDDQKRNQSEQFGEGHGQTQEAEQRQKDQKDISKRNPIRQDQEQEQDDEQQGNQRRAS